MLKDTIQQDLHQAQLARDEVKVSTLRMLLSEIRYAEIAQKGQLTDEEIIPVIAREVKKRREAAAGFRQGSREESAQKEEAEIQVLSQYLPQQLADEKLTKIIDDAINETGAKNISEMGKIMNIVMSKVEGRAEGSKVSSLVKEKLSHG